MSTFSKGLDNHRVQLFNIEARIRNNYKRITCKVKSAIESWLDDKTAPYGGLKK